MIVALAGRRVDAPDASTPRFPERNVTIVSLRIRDLLTRHAATTLVASAACGADLVAHSVARSLAMARVMVLPYSATLFRERSVVDRPGIWGELFDELISDARSAAGCEVVELGLSTDPNVSQSVYMKTNEEILNRAAELAAREPEDSVLCVAVWDGTSRGETDMTAAFIASAGLSEIPVEMVQTLA